MGNLNFHTEYQCCVSDSNFNEEDEQLATPRTILEEPYRLTSKLVDKIESFKTLPVLN